MSVKKGANCQRCTTTFHIFTRGIYPPLKGVWSTEPNVIQSASLQKHFPITTPCFDLWSYQCAHFLHMQLDIWRHLEFFFFFCQRINYILLLDKE